jgi:hypothetical protein
MDLTGLLRTESDDFFSVLRGVGTLIERVAMLPVGESTFGRVDKNSGEVEEFATLDARRALACRSPNFKGLMAFVLEEARFLLKGLDS